METDERRRLLTTGARLAAAAGLAALAAKLGLRGGAKDARAEGWCDRAGRCDGCAVTADCDAYRAMRGGPADGR